MIHPTAKVSEQVNRKCQASEQHRPKLTVPTCYFGLYSIHLHYRWCIDNPRVR